MHEPYANWLASSYRDWHYDETAEGEAQEALSRLALTVRSGSGEKLNHEALKKLWGSLHDFVPTTYTVKIGATGIEVQREAT